MLALEQVAKRRWRFKQEQSRGEKGAAEKARERAEEGGEGGRRLVCVRCGYSITTEDARIEKNGLHEHSQVNPHGFVWRFGCFAAAPGCAPSSGPSTEFSWFPGYAWQIESCRGCYLHLGWRFLGEDTFHGLILDRLVEADDDDRSPRA